MPSVFTPLSGGLHSHLDLSTASEKYNATTYTVALGVPANPATAPIHSSTATMVQITETIRLHGENCRYFQLYHNVEKSLCNQLIKATQSTFLQDLHYTILVIGQFNYLQMLTHLRKTYVNITQADLNYKGQNMSRAWKPPTPIYDLFEQLRVGYEIATKGGNALSYPQLIYI